MKILIITVSNQNVVLLFTTGKIFFYIFNLKLNLFRDERTGEVEGDDETIEINLRTLPYDVHFLWVFISISEENKFFNKVEGAYCRFMAGDIQFSR